MPRNIILPSFNAGELSPLTASRVDVEKYGSGCRELQNFVLTPYGGVNRRPGMEHLGITEPATGDVRLIGFNFSVTTNYVLEFRSGKLRFWSNGSLVMDDDEPLELVTPWTENLFDIQHVQINDVVYLVHPLVAPHKLSRIANDDWTLEEIDFPRPPMRDENENEGIWLTPSGVSGTITLTATGGNVFEVENVGGYFELVQRRPLTSTTKRLDTNGSSAALVVIGKWDFTTRGFWEATIYVERSTDGGATWVPIRTFTGNADRNITTSGDEETECRLRFRVADAEDIPDVDIPRGYFEVYESFQRGLVKITAVSSATSATATVKKALHSTAATWVWSEGAWSTRRGFARTVAFHDQRLVYGGCRAQPQTLWGSKINDFETFLIGTRDDDAYTFTLASAEQNTIQWLLSHQSLLIGTSGHEYVLDASGDASVVTPSNVQVQRHSAFGSSYLPAMVLNDIAVYVQRNRRKIREFVYNFERDRYVSPDLTLLAEHITRGEIVQMAFQQQPDSILWCVTGDGRLIGMTFERDQNVVGWHRHVTDGEVLSIAAIYGATGDEVWLAVRRSSDGEDYIGIERLDPDYRTSLDLGDMDRWFYVDAGTFKEEEAEFTVVDGLTWLEGKEVSILADGAVVKNQVVINGQITLDDPAFRVHLGLPYESILTPLALEMPTQEGSGQGKKGRIHAATVRYYMSRGGQIKTGSGDTWDEIFSRSAQDAMDAPVPATTGQSEPKTLATNFRDFPEVSIRTSQPVPLSILAIIAKADVYGD